MKNAFSLMELIVVILILGLLATLVLPNLIGKGEESKAKIVCIQMKSISQTLKLYKIDYSSYPSTQEGLNILSSKKYFDEGKLPKDPWKNEYIYTHNDEKFDLISFGPDKKESVSDDIYYSKCSK
ncbi:MAG: type II secretion system major pseudopilin GspG [Campylobacteraceae bacterium]|nr:type II secretion system major pseudopilin GspG [Campylobacteraceae bacterium]